jgi:hypothetical protein
MARLRSVSSVSESALGTDPKARNKPTQASRSNWIAIVASNADNNFPLVVVDTVRLIAATAHTDKHRHNAAERDKKFQPEL